MPRLTPKRLNGLVDLLAILDGIRDTGWEGTPFDSNYKDPQDSGAIESAYEWLIKFVQYKKG
jgi:hypothetical protein